MSSLYQIIGTSDQRPNVKLEEIANDIFNVAVSCKECGCEVIVSAILLRWDKSEENLETEIVTKNLPLPLLLHILLLQDCLFCFLFALGSIRKKVIITTATTTTTTIIIIIIWDKPVTYHKNGEWLGMLKKN